MGNIEANIKTNTGDSEKVDKIVQTMINVLDVKELELREDFKVSKTEVEVEVMRDVKKIG